MDALDKSTFSVYVSTSNPRRMVVSPQVKCSGEAIARFYQHILKAYPDAEIVKDVRAESDEE
jgi:hypothetical protein